MPYNGSGTYSPPAPPAFPALPGTTISSTYYNQVVLDQADALTLAMTRDGQSPALADIPLGGNKITGSADGVDPTDLTTISQWEAALNTGIQMLATISALRANTDLAGSVILRGYYSPLDLGGGVFEYDSTDTTSADNGGTIIVDASSRRWKRWLVDGSLNPQMFGAKCDLVQNDQPFVQAMFDAANSLVGNHIKLIAGQCLLNSGVTINYPVLIEGYGKQLQSAGTPYAGFVINFATGNAFTINHSQANTFRDFGIRASTTRTSGSTFALVGDGVNIPIGNVWTGLAFNGCCTSLSITNGKHWSVTNCDFVSYGYNGTGDAIYYPSTAFPDAGDVYILGNTFQSGVVAGGANYAYAAVYTESTFAINFVGNKVFGGMYGIVANAMAVSGNLILNGNSFEQQTFGHLLVTKGAGGGTIGNIVVTGNEFSILNSATPPTNTSGPTILIQAGSSQYVKNVVISGNVFNHKYNTTWDAIAILDGDGNIVSNNSFNFYSEANPSAIQVAGNATNSLISDNVFIGMTTAQRYLNGLNSTTVVKDTGLVVANLSAWGNGSQVYVSDGTPGALLSGGGTGSLALRRNGTWAGL